MVVPPPRTWGARVPEPLYTVPPAMRESRGGGGGGQFNSSLRSSQSTCESQRACFEMQNGRRPGDGRDARPVAHVKSDERQLVDAFHLAHVSGHSSDPLRQWATRSQSSAASRQRQPAALSSRSAGSFTKAPIARVSSSTQPNAFLEREQYSSHDLTEVGALVVIVTGSANTRRLLTTRVHRGLSLIRC